MTDTQCPPRNAAHWATAAAYRAAVLGATGTDAATRAHPRARHTWLPSWWPTSRRQSQATDTRSIRRVHASTALDIARHGADLLYADPPTLTIDDPALTTALTDTRLWDELATGARLESILGGRLHRITATGHPTHPWTITTHAPDTWTATITHGILTGATIYTVLPQPDGTREGPHSVWRHVEYHTLDQAGMGVITHQLWHGTTTSLGTLTPLTDHPATRDLHVRADGTWDGPRTPGLYVTALPLTTPEWVPAADILRTIDEAWSSLLRDIRLAGSRIIAPLDVLQSTGGRGGTLDLDQELFTGLDVLESGQGLDMQVLQPSIRSSEHLEVIRAARDTAFIAAGYDTPSDPSASGTMTAAEIAQRDRRTRATRARRILRETQYASQLITKLATLVGAPTDLPDLTWPPIVRPDPLAETPSIVSLTQAGVMSRHTAIARLHPDWDDIMIAAEEARITSEHGASMLTDPTQWDTSAGA